MTPINKDSFFNFGYFRGYDFSFSDICSKGFNDFITIDLPTYSPYEDDSDYDAFDKHYNYYHNKIDDIYRTQVIKDFYYKKNYLNLKSSLVNNEAIEHISKFKNLEYLDISYTEISDISFIKDLQQLKVLFINNCKYKIPKASEYFDFSWNLIKDFPSVLNGTFLCDFLSNVIIKGRLNNDI